MINYNYEAGRPIIFETMAFDKEGEVICCYRYATKAEAKKGHRHAELMLRGFIKKEVG